jgi:hypothetical protein
LPLTPFGNGQSRLDEDLLSSRAAALEGVDPEKSRTHGHGTETFTGSIAGVGSGTLTWGIHFDSAFDCLTFAVSDFSGRGVITSGTDALAGLHGSIQFGDTTYDGALH